MKKYLMLVVMVTALMMAGCGDADPPVPQFVSEFRKAKFSPELEDIVPAIGFGDESSGGSARSLRHARAARNTQSDEEVITIYPSDLLLVNHVEWIYDWFDYMKYIEEAYKNIAFDAIIDAESEKKNEWVNVPGGRRRSFKHELDDETSTIYYVEGDISIKFSMNVDGTNEMYFHLPDIRSYSSYDGEQYVYFAEDAERFTYAEFDQTGDFKEGIIAWWAKDRNDPGAFYAYSFGGTDDDMKMRRNMSRFDHLGFVFASSSVTDIKTGIFFMSEVRGSEDENQGGISLPTITADMRALNIEWAKAKRSSYYYHAIELGLTDDTVVEIEEDKYDVLQFVSSDWMVGKFGNYVTFAGGDSVGESFDEILDRWVPGVVSTEDYDMKGNVADATDGLWDFFTPFSDTFDFPLNLHSFESVTTHITEILQEYGTGFEDR